jgi:hypothetical protein
MTKKTRSHSSAKNTNGHARTPAASKGIGKELAGKELIARVKEELSGATIDKAQDAHEDERFRDLFDRYNCYVEVREILMAVLEGFHELEMTYPDEVLGKPRVRDASTADGSADTSAAYILWLAEAKKNQRLVQLYLARALSNPTMPNRLRTAIQTAIKDTARTSRVDYASLEFLEEGGLSPIIGDLFLQDDQAHQRQETHDATMAANA